MAHAFFEEVRKQDKWTWKVGCRNGKIGISWSTFSQGWIWPVGFKIFFKHFQAFFGSPSVFWYVYTYKVLKRGVSINCNLSFDVLSYLISQLSCFGPHSLSRYPLHNQFCFTAIQIPICFVAIVAVASLSVLPLRLRWGPRQLPGHFTRLRVANWQAQTSPLSLPSLPISLYSLNLSLSLSLPPI